MNFNTKAKLSIVFQPYLIVSLLGLLAAYGQYQHSENKYLALTGLAFFLGNLIIYIYLLLSKAMVIRSVTNFFVVGVCSFMTGVGQGNYTFGVTSSLLVAVGIVLLYAYEFKVARDIVTKNDFIKNIDDKPEYTLFFDDSIVNIFKNFKSKFKVRYKNFVNDTTKIIYLDNKTKFSNEMYTYINNEVVFDHKGIKNTEYSFDDVKKYMAESFQTIKDFNKDSLKTIEMLKY